VVRENKQVDVEIVAMNPLLISNLIDNPEAHTIAIEVDQRIRSTIT
jgi:hypothetical protein